MSEDVFGIGAEDVEAISTVLEMVHGEGDAPEAAEPETRVQRTARRLRLFWRIYIPVAALVLLAIPGRSLGPVAEGLVAPIRGAQSVRVVERTKDRLCWDWTFDKLRHQGSDEIDVTVDAPQMHGAAGAIYERDTGIPWGLVKYARPPGHYTMTYCLALPPYVQPTDPVRVNMVAWYPGFLGLWKIPVAFPEVVDPAGAVVP